jgi:hypothetical protein
MPTDHVKDIDESMILIEVASHEIQSSVQEMGAARARMLGHTWRIAYTDNNDLAAKLSKLRDLGLPFLGGPSGWPPAAVVAEFRDQGLMTGSYREIIWRGNGLPEVITNVSTD